MVAEKDETPSQQRLTPNKVKPLPCFNFPSSFSVKLIPSLNEEGESLDNVGEVVLSLRCKSCSFICPDKATLITHVKETHRSNCTASVSNSDNFTEIDSTASTNKNEPSASVTNGCKDNLSTCNNVQSEKRLYSLIGVQHNEEEGEDMFLCAECDVVFPSEELCCKHMSQVHNIKHFSAQFIREEIICKSSEAKEKPVRRQVRPPKQYTAEGGAVVPKKFRVTRDKFFSCSKCNVKFESSEVTKFHEQCHLKSADRNEKGFSCPVCVSQKPNESSVTAVFPIWGKISMHLWKEHTIDCELHTCSVCKKYKNHLITKVKDHEKLHLPDANYKCATCHKSFKQHKQLKTHEKYHKETKTKLPPPQDSRWYTPKECPICKRILADSKCLKKHISAVHNKLKPYGCNICGHTTARKAELQLHIRQHTGEKPYKCPFCSFATGDHNSLRNHKMRHSDTKPYICPYCEYRCIQSAPFKKHILAAHPGQEVVYLCQLCNHASVNEVLFAAHQKDHENDQESARVENSSSKGMRNDIDTNVTNTSAKIPADCGKSKSYWLDDEDESVEMVVDTGGITIPAPEVEPNATDIVSPGSTETASEIEGKSSTEWSEKVTKLTTAENSLTESSTAQTTLLPTMTLCLVKPSPPLEIFQSDESSNHSKTEMTTQEKSENTNYEMAERSPMITESEDDSLIETSPPKSLPTMTLSLMKCGPPLEIFDTDESANQCPSDSHTKDANGSEIQMMSLFPAKRMPGNSLIAHKDEVVPSNSIATTITTTEPTEPVAFLEPMDLSDIMCNEHSNDETFERLLSI